MLQLIQRLNNFDLLNVQCHGVFLLFGYLWENFKERAKDRGEMHVREVFDSFLGLKN